MPMNETSDVLSERYIQDSFHSYLKSSLTQAKAERLLDADILSSAESDLMITGPALCLYFAALRCTTHPPSVPLPRSNSSSKSEFAAPIDLSLANCPPTFAGFLRVWAHTVPAIQSLVPEHQHDLARVICGLDPLSQPVQPAIGGIAADLRAVAIEISQRRSFQDRFAADLQAALDAGTAPGSPNAKKASFVPPPVYDPSPSPSPRSSYPPSPHHTTHSVPPPLPSRPHVHTHLSPPPSTTSPTFPRPRRTPSPSTSPTLLSPDTPAISLIRETLYASIADALETHPYLHTLLTHDPPRAYFACVALAILSVSLSCPPSSPSSSSPPSTTSNSAVSSTTPDASADADTDSIPCVLNTRLTLSSCPPPLRPFMHELLSIGRLARTIEDEDDKTAVRCVQRGEAVPVGRMERVRRILERGVGGRFEFDDDEGQGDGEGYEQGRGQGERERAGRRRSVQGRAVAFANRVNALSLGMTRLRAFRERQDEVFRVLAGVGSS